MSVDARFLVPPKVLHQTIDDEVILVNMATGAYHSLRGSGARVFDAITRGASVREMVALLAAETDGAPTVIEETVSRFIAELVREELVRASQGTAAIAPEPAPGATRRTFEPPLLETFTDLQDLLGADPVHDVEPAGWPEIAGDKR